MNRQSKVATGTTARRSTRVMTWSFLGLFSACGVFGFELWPFTGWRLFADARERFHISWSPSAEYDDGTSGPLTLAAAGAAGTPFLIGRLAELPQRDRDDLCSQWLVSSASDRRVQRISIYRETRDLARRSGDRSAPPHKELAYVCERGRLEAVTP
jgi:hypothetical protein